MFTQKIMTTPTLIFKSLALISISLKVYILINSDTEETLTLAL